MTNCSLTLVALFLIGKGLGDSHLVILSLCSLVLFFVISFLLASLVFLFSPFLLPFYVSFSVLSVLPYVFMRFFYIIFLLIKKKKKVLILEDFLWLDFDFFYFFYYELFRVPGYFELLLVNFLTSGEEIIKLNIFTCQRLRRKQFIFLLFLFSLLNFCCPYSFWTLNSSHDHLYKYLQPKQSVGSWGSCCKTCGRIEKQLFQFYLISFL